MKVTQFIGTCLIIAGHLTLTSATDVNDGCPETTDTCLSFNGEVCNLVGSCVCGRCVCSGEYTGSTCGEGPTRQEMCPKFRDCAECKAFGTGNFGIMECIQMCDNIAVYSMVDEFTSKTNANCEFKNEDGCFYYFQVIPMGEQGIPEVILKNGQKCPEHEPEIVSETTVKVDVVVIEETYEYTSEPNLKQQSQHKSTTSSAASRLTLYVLHARVYPGPQRKANKSVGLLIPTWSTRYIRKSQSPKGAVLTINKK
ncbi:hypothetical protein CHS0354_020836 [Potamilus streckersoni]|uniref:Integrin beta subunit tail domain-containing protein n=1 Tax=Potamilus streckersoni TaxID=2493646 RepID=A0AAE0RUM9_9BIVA|nr:hypothetical protein CHS0354_020836 [Potamilus streckersoni]